MKYKRLIITNILIITFAFTTFAKADQEKAPSNLQEAVKMANQELANLKLSNEYFTQTNLVDKPINWVQITGLSSVMVGNTDNTYGALVYGDPHGDVKNNQSRYIGYTYKDEDYTNPAFPHDSWIGGYLEDRNWIEQPWKSVPGAVENSFDSVLKFLPNIQKGLALYYADVSRGGDSPYWDNWHKYVHILVPPTKYTWGMGRMWHNTPGGIWYISVPLTPGILTVAPDLSTSLETAFFDNVKQGDKITSTVAYKLNTDHPRPERALLRLHHVVDGVEYPVQLQPVNGAPAPDEKGYITLKPGDIKVYSYTFTVQDRPTKILSRINPVDTKEDKNWDNNRAEADVTIKGYDIKVKITPERQGFAAVNGEPALLSFKVRVTRKDEIPGVINIKGSNKARVDSKSFNIKLGPGEYMDIPYSFYGKPGSYTVESEAWPSGADDAHPPDNVDRIAVNVGNEEFKSSKGIHSEILDRGPMYR